MIQPPSASPRCLASRVSALIWTIGIPIYVNSPRAVVGEEDGYWCTLIRQVAHSILLSYCLSISITGGLMYRVINVEEFIYFR
jgi:hypothetical protein